MKKTLSLLLVLAMVLSSFSFAFAAEAEKTPGEILRDLGVLTGNAKGDLMLEDELSRQDMIVLLSRVLGQEDEAKAFKGEMSFKDVNDPFYKPYIAWAEANKLTNGVEEGKFGFGRAVTEQEVATLMLRALGYNDVEFKDVPAKAAELKLVDAKADLTVNCKRARMAEITLAALGTKMNGSDKTLAEKLGIELPKPAKLEIVEVKANNLKEIVVEFNNTVDPETVADANFAVKGVKSSAALLEDGKTVVLTVNDPVRLNNQATYTLTVNNVKDLAGNAIEKTVKEFKAFDQTLPEVKEVVVTGPRTFELVFSEPIEKAGKVEVKLDKTILGNKVTANGTDKVTVDVFANFIDEKEYSITVTGFEDYAGYKNVINTLTFVYAKDVTPPVATVAKADQTYVVVDFNKPVKGIKQDSFYHTFNAWTSLGVYSDADMKTAVKETESVSRVYVKFFDNSTEDLKKASRPLPEGNVRFGIFGKNIKDNWGNVLGEVEVTVAVAADKVAPEVASIEVTGEDKLKVKFNKDVDFGKDNIEILDADGKKISGLTWAVTANSAKEYVVTLSKDMAGKVVTVSIKDVKDLALIANKLSLYTQLVEITDKTPAEVEKVYYNIKLKDGETEKFETKQLAVIFSEEVDSETALKASNYSLVNGKEVTILSQTPYFDINSARVIIPLTDAEAKVIYKAPKTVKLQVINVKDLAGNIIIPVLNDITSAVTETNIVEVKSIKAVATDKLVVEFSDILTDVNGKHFGVYVDGVKKDSVVSQSEDGGVTVLEFTLEKDTFKTDKSNVALKYVAPTEEKDKMKNSFGIGVDNLVIKDKDGVKATNDFGPEYIADKIAPEIEVKNYGTTEKPNNKYQVEWVEGSNEINITFSEKINGAALSTLVFGVEDAVVTKVEAKDNVVTITLKEAPKEAPKISQKLEVYDMSDNAFKADKTLESVKIAAPKSSDASIKGITVKGVAATKAADKENVYNVELEKGTVLSELVATDIVVTKNDEKATVGTATTADEGKTWTVEVTAEDGTTKVTYTINVTVAAE